MSLRSRARGSERGSHLQQGCGYNADMLNTRLACQNGDIHWCGDMRRRVWMEGMRGDAAASAESLGVEIGAVRVH